MKTVAAIVFHLVVGLASINAGGFNTQLKKLKTLDKLLTSYDRRETPTNYLDQPTHVECEIYIRSFGSINPATMDYQTDLYLRQRWNDSRLMAATFNESLDLNDPNFVKRIWKPEVFFPNAKFADFQYVTVPNVLVRINPGGEILYMLRLKLTFSCMMKLQKYPLDSQVCHIEIGSFSKTLSELNLTWYGTEPVKLYSGLTLPQFRIERIQTTNCRENFQIGEYSCLKAEFFLQRNIGYHLVQNYLPTILIVVISWVSFFLGVDAIPARITLGVTTLLTISSKGSGIQSSIPPVSYVKAVDVWMGACTTMVFSALLEFTLVNYLWRRKRQVKSSDSSNGDASEPWLKLAPVNENENRIKEQPVSDSTYMRQSQSMAQTIDRLSGYLFPLSFLVFNIFYWPYYMS
ncbi:GLRA3 (predicted) [Pycnogonum litorale]